MQITIEIGDIVERPSGNGYALILSDSTMLIGIRGMGENFYFPRIVERVKGIFPVNPENMNQIPEPLQAIFATAQLMLMKESTFPIRKAESLRK